MLAVGALSLAHLEVISELGNFRILLLDQAAPLTCAYFAESCRRGAFNDGRIFRIVSSSKHNGEGTSPIDVVQVGTRHGFSEARTVIRHEHSGITRLRHERWTVSAARFSAGELYNSFFVCLNEEPALDFGGSRHEDGQGFAAFARVVAGQEVIEHAHRRAEDADCLSTSIAITDIQYSD